VADQSLVTISSPTPQANATVNVYDLAGKPVGTLYEGPLNSHEPKTVRFERKGLATGMYLILLRVDGYAVYQKVVIE
jgi:hypothetical protein